MNYRVFQKMKKILAIFAIVLVLFVHTMPVHAEDVPTAPSAPSTPTTSSDQAPNAPLAPSAPSSPSGEQHTDKPSDKKDTNKDSSSSDQQKSSDSSNSGSTGSSSGSSSSPTHITPTPTPGGLSSSGSSSNGGAGTSTANQGSNLSGQQGDATIKTGNATNTGVSTTTGNNNAATSPSNGLCTSCGSGSGAGVINKGNGSGSSNDSSVGVVNTDNTVQNNSAAVGNNVNQSTLTGNNTASQNVGDSTIATGNANTAGTIVTAVNTNVDGVAVSQFNVNDDHKGDLVLDFGANCIAGCPGTQQIQAANNGNGSNSQNAAGVTATSDKNTFQKNDATVGNNLTLSADSGHNAVNENTNGTSTIQTGNAQVDANVLTFVNNNLAGNVVFGVVNIFGNLNGDIIIPQSAIDAAGNGCSSCGGSTTAANNGNGSNSTNDASANQNSTNNTFQTNDATIENNLTYNATTGGNEVSRNTGDDSYVKTGSATVDSQTLNIANSNINGGTWWLVIVNKAGEWIGKIVGAPDGVNYAGSQGTEFKVGTNGQVTAVNGANGSNSDNSTKVNQSTNNTTVQNNTAAVQNNLNLSANTGANQANDNTGGASTIKTGNAKVVADLVNFVNNNVSRGGKLVVTFVNVFGSWVGDLVTPGQQQQPKTASSNSSQVPSQQTATPTPTTMEVARAIGGVGVTRTSSPSQPTPPGKVQSNGVSHVGENSSFNSASGFEADITPSQKDVKGISASALSQVSVAGLTTMQGAQKTSAKEIKINLAWIVILVPMIALFFSLKKKITALTASLRKGSR